MEELKCDICGKVGFKNEAGLAGHKKIAHGEDRRKTTSDKLGERLEAIEMQLAGANPGEKVDALEGLVTTLKLLLPAMEKYEVTVGNLGQRSSWGFISDPKYRIVKNSDLEHSGIGGQCLKAKAKEL